ncbi:GTPase IMAP family member 8-like isoform 2-T2 [Clarias gariepinus]|uniref:GTPase IMAP family member 8 isoform X2 n=1 Tax=Clarias gariepinus TaxID=13013 RepID=UPI00234E100E|nr:GTPase IMAP family member 8 isoform X2 [Clarias gariepinus]
MSADESKTTLDNSVQIVLIGATGSGKSSSGNTILRQKLFKSEASAKSVTCECYNAEETINGRQVRVLDTPGWDCTELTKDEVMSRMKEALQHLDGPYSFLLVIRIGSMESEEEISRIYGLKEVFGATFLDHTTILFSRSDDLQGNDIKQFIEGGSKEFCELLQQCGNRYHCWNNRDKISDETVEKLLNNLKATLSSDICDLDHFGAMSADESKTTLDNSVQIVLIGATGSGKSSSGNTILRQKLFKSEASAKSVTCECYNAEETINGRQVRVLDTPGWDCTELTKDEVMSRMKEALQHLDGPYSFLLVIRIGSMESEEEISRIYGLKEVFGATFLDHTTILFSRSEDLQGNDIKQFIEGGSKEFCELLQQCGNRYHCWNNRDKISDETVEKLLNNLKGTEIKNTNTEKSEMHNAEEIPLPCPRHSGKPAIRVPSAKRSNPAVALEGHANDNHIRVLFLGMKRVGKTSSIKTLLDNQSLQIKAEERPLYSCTWSGLSLKLIESPGFEDELEQIEKAIFTSLSDCSPGPHVIIIVLSVERFTPAVKTAMEHVQNCLGQNARKHTMILFTGADNLEGKPIEIFIQDNEDLHKLVNKSRFHALNNRDSSNKTQVDELLYKIKDLYEKNNEGYYTKNQSCPDFDNQKGMPPEKRSSFSCFNNGRILDSEKSD